MKDKLLRFIGSGPKDQEQQSPALACSPRGQADVLEGRKSLKLQGKLSVGRRTLQSRAAEENATI